MNAPLSDNAHAAGHAAPDCWLADCLPAEVFPFALVRAFRELMVATELRGRYERKGPA